MLIVSASENPKMPYQMFVPPSIIGRNLPGRPISHQLSKIASLTICFRYSLLAKFRQLERFQYKEARDCD